MFFHFRLSRATSPAGLVLIPDDAVTFAVVQNHLPRPYASKCAGMKVGVEGAAKSLHLPRLHALQVTPAGASVEGDFVLGWPE